MCFLIRSRMEKILEVDSYRTHTSEGFRLESIGINMGPSHVEFNVPLVYSPVSPLSFLRDTVPDILHFQAYANYHINLFLYPVTASIPPCLLAITATQIYTYVFTYVSMYMYIYIYI